MVLSVVSEGMRSLVITEPIILEDGTYIPSGTIGEFVGEGHGHFSLIKINSKEKVVPSFKFFMCDCGTEPMYSDKAQEWFCPRCRT